MSPSFGDDLSSCEIFDSRNNTWRTVTSMIRPRGYHSTALLLPDGSVFVGGDQGEGSDPNETTAEIYFPWYFTASRPALTSAPAQAGFGEEVSLGTPAADISRVVLIRMASTTHGLNTDQRAVELPFRAGAGSVIATTPASPNVAPPGYYMAFLIDSRNVPSTSRFIRLSGSAATLPVVTVAAGDNSAAEAGGATGQFTVSRTGATTAPLIVTLSVSGTASNGPDYAAIGSSVTIPAGSASAAVMVTPVDDSLVEGNETVVLNAAPAGSYTVGSPASATVTIADNDSAPPPPNQLPQVSITRPAGGATFVEPADVVIDATATDSDGTVTRVDFFANGNPIGSDTTSGYSVTWTGVAAGTWNLTAVATDDDGATRTSSPVTITVTTVTPPPTTPPAVSSLTLINADTEQPIATFDPFIDGDQLDLGTLPTRNLSVRANTTPVTVGSVRFDYDGNPNYRMENGAPYSLNGDNVGDYAPWTPTVGNHSLRVTAYSQASGAGVAGAPLVITFSVIDTPVPPPPPNQPPQVSITRPAGGATFVEPADVVIDAAASDPDGTVSRVDFFANGNPIGTDTTAGFSVTWAGVTAGTWNLTAVARDNGGATVTSAAVTITVAPATPPPPPVVPPPPPPPDPPEGAQEKFWGRTCGAGATGTPSGSAFLALAALLLLPRRRG